MSPNSRPAQPSSSSSTRPAIAPAPVIFVLPATVIEAESLFIRLVSDVKPLEEVIVVRDHRLKPVVLLEAAYGAAHSPFCFLSQFFIFVDPDKPKPPRVQPAGDRDCAAFHRGLSRLSRLDTAQPACRREALALMEEFAAFIFAYLILSLLADGSAPIQNTSPSVSTTSSERAKGVSKRSNALPPSCLKRDRHRCVVTEMFHIFEYKTRHKSGSAVPPLDDDNQKLDYVKCEYVEVAHIIPHSLMTAESQGTSGTACGANARVAHSDPALSDARKQTVALLQMFSPNILNIINGSLIDTPANALSLCHRAHVAFGGFEIYFVPFSGSGPHTHIVKAFESYCADWLASLDGDRVITHEGETGIKVTLRGTEQHPAPSDELLRVHRAIGRLFHLSAAGYAAEDVQRDPREVCVPLDESAGDGLRLSLTVQGWLDGLRASG